MRHILRVQVLGAVPEIEISSEEFNELHTAHRVLFAGVALEEKFELLLSNYVDLEKDLLSLSVDQMVRGEISYERLFDARTTLNRKLINLLTTARLYVDHLPHQTNEIIGNARQSEVKALLSVEYDSFFEFRFMEALRNYVQHRGFPAHGLSFPSHWVEGKRKDLVYSVEFSAVRERLSEDGVFKKTILAEMPTKVDLKATVRFYVECLDRVHQAVRILVTPTIDCAREKIRQTMERYEAVYHMKPLGLAALQQDEHGVTLNAVPLLLDWERIRQELVTRNRALSRLRDRCVSSAIQTS